MDGGQVSHGFNRTALAQVPAALQTKVDDGTLSGFVTLAWRHGETAQVNTIGWRDIAAKAPMQRDTLFRIASMTKPITSVTALMLMEEGKLKLEDPVAKWIPELAERRVLKTPTGPVDDTYPAPREITILDLMTHRTGLAYGFSSEGPIAHAYQDRLGSPLVNGMGPDAWLKGLGTLPLTYPPGERFHYSVATDVLGFLISRIEGKRFGEVLKRRIFDPLGMVDTAFWQPPEKRGRMAKLYKNMLDGGPLKDDSLTMADKPQPFEGGGGGLISTADDYLKFARAMLGRGEVDGVRLVKPETIDMMTTNRLTDAQRQIPFLGLPFWRTQGFGLGVSTIMDAELHQTFAAGSKGAFGWPGAFGTWWQADPAEDMILIYLIQDSMPLGPEAVTAMQGQRPIPRLVLPMFQKMVYAALDK
jgi:CubicO group peptidase (beta-lactamase class C family)